MEESVEGYDILCEVPSLSNKTHLGCCRDGTSALPWDWASKSICLQWVEGWILEVIFVFYILIYLFIISMLVL